MGNGGGNSPDITYICVYIISVIKGHRASGYKQVFKERGTRCRVNSFAGESFLIVPVLAGASAQLYPVVFVRPAIGIRLFSALGRTQRFRIQYVYPGGAVRVADAVVVRNGVDSLPAEAAPFFFQSPVFCYEVLCTD